ncbi:MAG: Bax inhibitor-1/YccA family protein [Eubacteriales bacterium]
MSIELSNEELEQRSFITKVYGWMSLALVITGLVAIFTASSSILVDFIFGNRWVFYALLISEVVLVMYLAAAVKKISASMATLAFIAYAALNGLTISVIFLVFTEASIASTFFITAGTFGIMSAYGYFTKRDLTGWGEFCLMGLVGIILASIVNFFFLNETVYWVTTYIGIIVFIGLTAYDTQKIKKMNVIGNEGTEEDRKESIMGALTLYLDFINLFLYLLRIFGRRK